MSITNNLSTTDNSSEIKKAIQEYGGVEKMIQGYTKPLINIRETKTHVIVDVALPGFTKENVSLEIEPESIEIRAISEINQDTHNLIPTTTHKKEIVSGKIKRRIELPHPIATHECAACMYNGILTVEMKKPDDTIGKEKVRLEIK